MKKILFFAAVLAAVTVTSCKSDDNGGGDDDCTTCSFEGDSSEESVEFCNNGDGTYTIDGVEQDIPDGTSFNQIITAFELLGADCN
jgi:hypothetical protein